MDLIHTIQQSKEWESLNQEEREIFLRLANRFQEVPVALYMDIDELSSHMGVGNRRQWARFLSFPATARYIDYHIELQTQSAYRKALQSLQIEANKGSVQAAKEINALAEAKTNQQNNQTIVIINVARPSPSHDTGRTTDDMPTSLKPISE